MHQMNVKIGLQHKPLVYNNNAQRFKCVDRFESIRNCEAIFNVRCAHNNATD